MERRSEPPQRTLLGQRAWFDPVEYQRSDAIVRQRLLGRARARPRILFGRYVVGERLGGGGQGLVYSAYDPELGRRVAVKFLHTPGMARALLHQARAMARVAHANVVRIYDVGYYDLGFDGSTAPTDHDDRGVFVVMELVDGQDLASWLTTEVPTWRAVVDAFVQAGLGLHAVHQQGLVHGDFKPSNVLRDRGGHVRVLDFGLPGPSERLVDERETRSYELDPGAHPAGELQRGGTIDGASWHARRGAWTTAYAAPEVLSGDCSSAAADQYAFCASLRHALELVTHGAVPRPLSAVLDRGQSIDPDARFASLSQLLRRLRRIRTRRRRWCLAAGTLSAALTVGAIGAAVAGRPASTCVGFDSQAQELYGARAREVFWSKAAALGADRDSEPAQEFEHRLQRFTRTWTAKRSEICEASQHSAGIEAALWNSVALCLDRQLARAMGTLRVITAEARLTDSDLRVFGEWLEAPRACIPSEPQAPTREQAGAVAEVEAGLLEIRTDRGRVPPYERIARLERLDARAQAANNPRLQAEVSFHLGLAYGSVANADAAREAYVRGLGHAERAGDDVLAIDIGVHLATRATAAADRALGILDVLHARAEGLALGPRVFALLETSRAQILAANERCGLALAAAQRAQDHLGREPREIDPLMRGVLLPRFVCLQAGGHHGQAFDTYREYADLSRRYSSNDREAIRLDTILGRLAVAAGRMDEAIAIADRNVNESRHLGREHSDLLAGSLALRAQLHRLMGEPERARRKLRAALEALAAADPGHDATAEIHLELAVLAAQLDRSYTYKQRAP